MAELADVNGRYGSTLEGFVDLLMTFEESY
jgi:hypothetical protein